MASRRVTIRNVAEQAGVSVATVSLVLNGSGERLRIAPDTQARVRATARALGYIADGRAQSLRKGFAARTVLIVFVARQVPDAFFVDILHSLDEAAGARGRDTQFQLAYRGEPGRWDALRAAAKACAGVIVVGSIAPDQSKTLDTFPVPVVQVGGGERVEAAIDDPAPDTSGREARGADHAEQDGHAGHGPHGAVRVDNRLAGRLVTEHLLALGHRQFAILGPDEERWYAPFVERGQGIEGALRLAGAPAPAIFMRSEPDPDTLAQVQALGATAAVCLYDRLALRVLRVARLAGIHVPATLSVAGFDDMEWSALLSPSLTTIHIPRREMAIAAMDHLEALLRGEQPNVLLLTPTLAVRESTAHSPSSRSL
jgi:DNA-binding LacI/PurR family transcriptional regulator